MRLLLLDIEPFSPDFRRVALDFGELSRVAACPRMSGNSHVYLFLAPEGPPTIAQGVRTFPARRFKV